MKKISSVSWQCIGIWLPGGIDWIDIVNARRRDRAAQIARVGRAAGTEIAALRPGEARVERGLKAEHDPVLAPIGKRATRPASCSFKAAGAIVSIAFSFLGPQLMVSGQSRVPEFRCLALIIEQTTIGASGTSTISASKSPAITSR